MIPMLRFHLDEHLDNVLNTSSVKNARRTERLMQWYQRVIETSTRWRRGIGDSPRFVG